MVTLPDMLCFRNMDDIFKEISAKAFYGKKKFTLPPDPNISDGSDTDEEEGAETTAEDDSNSPFLSGKQYYLLQTNQKHNKVNQLLYDRYYE